MADALFSANFTAVPGESWGVAACGNASEESEQRSNMLKQCYVIKFSFYGEPASDQWGEEDGEVRRPSGRKRNS